MTVQLRAVHLLPVLLACFVQASPKQEKMKVSVLRRGTIYDYEAIMLKKKEYVPFERYVGKQVLFVNLATYCGLTAQYPEELKPFGLVVLGFPCTQFGKQEPGDNRDSSWLPGNIMACCRYVCRGRGGGFVPNFQLFEKGDVNGEKEQKVFSFLKHSCPHPSEILGTFKSISWDPVKVHDIRWNFEKFLVGPDEIPVMRWSH
uniref:Glutathione peroxidase n=1 Tax=Aotus nancymaae TaxID=37293 RepID=A0A2K5CKJ0_AOTNA